MAPQLAHEALAEGHDLTVALTLGGEVSAALAATHRQRGECILEGLLEAEELQDGEVDRGMEADTALVGADGVVELHAVADVDMHLTSIVYPGHAEGDDTVWLHEALHDGGLLELRVLVVHLLYREEHFFHGLEEFLLSRVLRLKRGEDFCGFHTQ